MNYPLNTFQPTNTILTSVSAVSEESLKPNVFFNPQNLAEYKKYIITSDTPIATNIATIPNGIDEVVENFKDFKSETMQLPIDNSQN
jgi:hypothetical protein